MHLGSCVHNREIQYKTLRLLSNLVFLRPTHPISVKDAYMPWAILQALADLFRLLDLP